jgi:hypothetical protein
MIESVLLLLWIVVVDVCYLSLSLSFSSPSYAAPELSTPEHDNKVDVFSFAVLLWELYTR